jgi:heptose-I-phosphate ethanolaminephosphotransferase
MIDDLPHLLLFLAGIHTPFYNEERCIISDSFDVSRRRLINGIVDYDQVVDKR